MFLESIEEIIHGIFTWGKEESGLHTPVTTALTLPLERTALEELNYTKWVYSAESTRLKLLIKKDFLNFTKSEVLTFNSKQNSFLLQNPEPQKVDQFYYLFDLLKETILNFGFSVEKAVKESTTRDNKYVEIERYVLVNPELHQILKIEIVSAKGKNLEIIGYGFPIDFELDHLAQSWFVGLMKTVLDINY